MADIEVKTYNGQKVIGVALRSKAKTIHFLRHAEGQNKTEHISFLHPSPFGHIA